MYRRQTCGTVLFFCKELHLPQSLRYTFYAVYMYLLRSCVLVWHVSHEHTNMFLEAETIEVDKTRQQGLPRKRVTMRHKLSEARAIPRKFPICLKIDNIDSPSLFKHRAFCLGITIFQLDLDPSTDIETVAEPLQSCCANN